MSTLIPKNTELLDSKTINLYKQKYKKNEWPFFYHEIMLGKYWKKRRTKGLKTFVVVGSKNTGKTTSFIKWAVKRAIENRHTGTGKFVLVRRTAKEAQEYWNVDTSYGSWWERCVCSKGVISWIDDKNKHWPIAKIDCIGGSGKGRGRENKGYDVVLFDDFIGMPGENMITGFNQKLTLLVSNYCRVNLPKSLLIMIGNNDRRDAEWLSGTGIQIPPTGGLEYITKNNLNVVLYSEGIKTKEGIISPHLKNFDDSCLSWGDIITRNYLYSNYALTNDEGIIYWVDCELNWEKGVILQLVLNKQMCIMEEYLHKKYGKINVIYEDVNQTNVDRSKGLVCLHPDDLGYFQGSVLPSTCEEISQMLFNQLNRGKLFFTDPETRKFLIMRLKNWISKEFLTEF